MLEEKSALGRSCDTDQYYTKKANLSVGCLGTNWVKRISPAAHILHIVTHILKGFVFVFISLFVTVF